MFRIGERNKSLTITIVSISAVCGCSSLPDKEQIAVNKEVATEADTEDIDCDSANSMNSDLLVSEELNDGKVKPLYRRAPLFSRRPTSSGQCLGEVVVKFNVSDAGNPTDVCVARSNYEALKVPTIKAVKTWKFEPKTGDEPSGYRESLQTEIRLDFCS